MSHRALRRDPPLPGPRALGVRAPLVLAVLLAVFLAVGVASSQAAPGLVLGGSLEVASGTTMHGDLTTVGADVIVAEGAVLDGRLTSIGGSVVVDGTVRSDVDVFGGELRLGPSGRVLGDVRATAARYQPAPGSVVDGRVEGGTDEPIIFRLPRRIELPSTTVRVVSPRSPWGVVPQSVALGMLAFLVAWAMPRRVTRMRDAVLAAPLRNGLEGLLVMVVAVVVLVVLAVTLVGIPFALLLAAALYLTVLFGWVALGDAVGARLSAGAEAAASRSVWTAVGTVIVALALLGIGRLPVLGGLLWLAVSAVVLGAARRTRFGGRAPGGPEPATPPAAPPAADPEGA